MDTLTHIFYVSVYNREKEASDLHCSWIQIKIIPVDSLTEEENMKISLYLSQFDLMKFGDIDSLVSVLSKLI